MRVDQIGVAGAPQSQRNHRHLRRRQQPTAQLAQTPQHLNIGVHRANDSPQACRQRSGTSTWVETPPDRG